MKKITITCDKCGNEFVPDRESDYYTLFHTTHYMIPLYDPERHFCSHDCLEKLLVGSKQ